MEKEIFFDGHRLLLKSNEDKNGLLYYVLMHRSNNKPIAFIYQKIVTVYENNEKKATQIGYEIDSRGYLKNDELLKLFMPYITASNTITIIQNPF